MPSPAEAPTSRRARGDAAERLAWRALAARGYRPFRRNVRAGGGELDILAWHGATLVFVEVRSRATAAHGSPLETVGPAKQARVARAARAVLADWGGAWPEQIRFDVVGVILSPGPQVQVVPAAWVLDD